MTSHDLPSSVPTVTRLSRRRFLGLAGACVGAALVPGALGTAEAAAATPRFPGHQPGRIYLGMSTSLPWADAVAQTGPVGLRRSFATWDAHARQLRTVAEDHAAGRLPWVSFRVPTPGAAGWREVNAGRYDEALRSRARDYARLGKPVIVTYHHEPGNESTEADGPAYTAAWCRIFDLFEQQGALRTVCFAPILSDWTFQERNRAEDPATWVSRPMLARISRNSFLGVDVYQNRRNATFAERLGAVIDWTASRGYPSMMVGVGEMGACRYFGDSPKPEAWIADNWSWAVANTSRIAAISYFNSTANSKDGHNWRLDEAGTTKLARYRSMLAHPVTCRL
jgi:hypothetical protein